jgi:cellulose synthase/poly-beta-1,6-N-acetylglucosamine synthase-like glycosyltransferase/peptidoglycan/xylan/chitin deacetylase (PgdA/CDA1 family)
MAKAIFHDPQRKRWKRLRIVFDALAAVVSLSIVVFVLTLMHSEPLPSVLLPQQKRPYRAIKEKEKERRRPPKRTTTHRKTKTPPSQVALNSEEGIRGAFYVTWDAGSFSALKAYYAQIDLLFPEWLHVMSPDGRLQGVSLLNTFFDVVQNGQVHPVDDQVMPFLKEQKAETEVFPLVNNFQPISNEWLDIGGFLMNAGARANFRRQLMLYLASDKYRGVSLDFEGFPGSAQPGFRALVGDLEADLHARGLKLYVNVPAGDDDFDYKYLAAHSDGLILMDYDQHSGSSSAGPIAGQDWFISNLEETLKLVPKEKLVCGIGNYGYDWVGKSGSSISVQDAWLAAHDSEAEVEFDGDSLNPHFAYSDENNHRHDVWWLDGVTALNEMRAARKLGINTFALWRLGSEDRSLWAVWDTPAEAGAPDKLKPMLPGYDVDMEGSGEIIRIDHRPQKGDRGLTVDASGQITDETFDALPLPYQVALYGSQPKSVAITFDDGPDPSFTPKILDVLKAKGVKATFFLIGTEAQKEPGITKQIYREGHEIGNHTFYHPDISNISKQYMKFELNMTERLFAAKLGVKPVLFRPPYSIDQEPDTADQVRPLEIVQDMGYITVGDKIDPSDWKDNPHRTAQEITNDVLAHLPPCAPTDWLHCGNIILLHDGGGDRTQTVKALPVIIDGLRAKGYNIVPVSELMGKQIAEVMPPIAANERWAARVDSFVFWLFGLFWVAIVVVFFVGDVLMTFRLLFVGVLAVFDRLREGKRDQQPPGAYRPPVAVLIPAFNEEKVIVNTVHAVLGSDYPALRVIVVDDGSKDNTYEMVCEAFQRERDRGQVLVLTKENSGKAEALNFGLARVEEEIFIGIDADTIIAPDAISKLVDHFADPEVAAVAGNTKVGNRVNLWTRWQALEYITSQNFERRALDVFGAVTVVPGAIGAWRTPAVRDAGGFQPDTVAEDADLTMSLLDHGRRVYYEDRALAWTEAPTRPSGLMRQRFRWSFGILQSVWKHRRAFARKGTLGWVALPNIVIFQILLPLVSPFIDVMFIIGALSYAVNRYFHPLAADPADFIKLVVFFAAFLVIDFIASVIAFSLERREAGRGEDVWLLAHVWLQRFAYRQLFSIVLFKTLKRAIDGKPFSWEKLERTAAVTQVRRPVGASRGS